MNRAKTDQHIKDSIYNHETFLDTQEVWENIAPEVIKKKKRRGIIWWFLGGFLMIGFLLIGFLFIQGNNLPYELRFKSKDEISNVDNQAWGPKTTKNPTLLNINPVEKTANSINPTIKLVQNPKTISQKTDLPSIKKQDSIFLHPFSEGESPVKKQRFSFTKIPTKQLDQLTYFYEYDQLESVSKQDRLDLFAKISPLAYSFLQRKEESLSPLEAVYLPERAFEFSINLESGVYSIARNLSLKDGFGANNLLEHRKQVEKPLEALSGGLLFKVNHRSGLYLKTGYQFLRINESLKTTVTITERDTIQDGIQTIIIKDGGDTTFITGPVGLTRNITTRKGIYSTYDWHNVPFLLGYEQQFNRFFLGLEAGVLVNFQSRYSGKMLLENRETLVPVTSDFLEHQIGVIYLGGLQFRYRMSPKLSLYTGVQGHFFPESIAADSNPINQKYTLIGGKLGLSYHFGN